MNNWRQGMPPKLAGKMPALRRGESVQGLGNRGSLGFVRPFNFKKYADATENLNIDSNQFRRFPIIFKK
jgi:hypothetical protein